MKKYAGITGLTAVSILIVALIIFGSLNADFSFVDDYISKLGASGEPYALGWNLIGFVLVGLLLFIFGILYGKLLNDLLLALLLSLFGLGFAFTAIPADMKDATTPFSKAHVVAICLGLACWLLGLARIGYNREIEKGTRIRANIAAVLLVVSMVGFSLELWSMPVSHRLVFGIVFGWTALTSIGLIMDKS